MFLKIIFFEKVNKKLFINPLLNIKLFGKEIILKMIENIYINDSYPEYQNIIITDKNRGYVKVYNNGKWQTNNIHTINIIEMNLLKQLHFELMRLTPIMM